MNKDEIKMCTENIKLSDKKHIVSDVRKSTLNDDIGCSILEEGIIKSCEMCSLQRLCDWIDENL